MSSLDNIELIGADGCPYVQRPLALLIEKSIPFKYTNIDLINKPATLLEKNPLGKVPVLVFPDGSNIFESAVILELIDDLLPPEKRVTPKDPIIKAQNNAWGEYFGSIFMDYYNSVGKQTKEEFEAAIFPLSQKFKIIESVIKGPYFNGEEVALIDFFIAPLAQRLFVLDETLGIDVGEKQKMTKLYSYLKRVSEMKSMNTAAFLQMNAFHPSLDTFNNIKEANKKRVDPKEVHARMMHFKELIKVRHPHSYVVTHLLPKL